ncbi:MAG: winged helix-turn-helix transcriptional regulator [Haloferacaceae archaeon]
MSKASTPRAVIHKRILDVARDQPNASIERIAGEVSGATPDLVDRVLDDYGDPAEADAEAVGDADDPEFSVEELTDRQCEILQTIYENPDASQRTLAGYLGITAPTVSRHLNKIPNWDWDRRLEFGRVVVEHVESNGRGAEETDADELDADEPDGDEVGSAGPDGDEPDSQETETAEPGASDSGTDDPDGEEATDEEAEADGPEASDARATEEETDARATEEETGARATEEASVAGIDRRTIDRLDERIEGLERRLDGGEEPRLVLDDPELVQRVIHVCMDADAIDEDDELRIIEALLT